MGITLGVPNYYDFYQHLRRVSAGGRERTLLRNNAGRHMYFVQILEYAIRTHTSNVYIYIYIYTCNKHNNNNDDNDSMYNNMYNDDNDNNNNMYDNRCNNKYNDMYNHMYKQYV